MDDATGAFVDAPQVCFMEVNDPRVVGRCDHRL